MIDLDRELRATLDERARLAPPPVDARPAIRAARRRQLVVVLTAIAVAAIVAIGSTAGAISLLRSSGRLTPANPSEGSTAAPVPAALRATVAFDFTHRATCTYTGPRTIVAGQQYLRMHFKDRSRSRFIGLLRVDMGELRGSATIGELVAWWDKNVTHSFPPERFLVPGSVQTIGGSFGSSTDPGRYYVACSYLYASGVLMQPATTLLKVTDG
jgi:hypothetical protein